MTKDKVVRRRFLAATGSWLGLIAIDPAERVLAAPKWQKTPFTLGIASGDPAADGFVIWTRLALDPLAGGGMPQEAVPVEWRVSTDEQMTKVVRKGTATASPSLAHSVHVELQGLDPSRWYFYRFHAGNWESEIGRARTAPAPTALAERMRFAFASCQHYETGLYTAYEHMAKEDLDLVVHLGDYIYEGRPNARVRKHNSPEIVTLSDYRNRYALYKGDKSLQLAHARFPWIVTWDDHEVDNDYASDSSEDNQPREQFLERRASAYQAYYEHMPLRRSTMPSGSKMALYRSVPYGQLAEFFVLDTRQYRSKQPCGAGRKALCAEALDDKRTILGTAQREWLFKGLGDSRRRWNILANQVPIGAWDALPGPEQAFAMDKWAGYVADRGRVLDFLLERKIRNMVVVTGDIHSNWVLDVKRDLRDPASATVATEFVGTSITSSGDGQEMSEAVKRILPENPQVKFFNGQRGYVSCTVNAGQWRSDYRIVPYVSRPGAPVETKASMVVENGKPGAEQA